ncbi:hypothetical protein C8R46DRAFT_1074113 [Mycena filopes]|nr:hypothetical protein C8R46DRAFT_1074113 [Mycena filopes]
MATPSPGNRLRPKTDIADFFRAGNSSKSQSQFLGRPRKKSTVSDASSSSAGRLSDSDVRQSNVSSRKAEPRPALPPLADSSERPLPATPINTHSPSLGSKIAARFAPSRQKLLNLSPRKPLPPSTNDHTSDALSSRTSPSRGTSADSSSDHRSTTPRPVQPTITVSLPPDNLEGYEGMFTLPTATRTSDDDPPSTPTAAAPTPLRFPASQASARHPGADTTVKRRSSRSVTEERSSSRSSRMSRKPIGDTFKHTEVDSTDAEDSEAIMSDSPRPSPSMAGGPTPIAEKRRTLATMPYSYSSPKSIMKPTSDRPSIDSSAAPRQRAHTLSGVSSPILPISPSSPLSALPSRRITKSTVGGTTPVAPGKVGDEPTGKENLDLEKASAEQLRQALALRNQQFDELASYLLKITEAHKVASLEQDATRKDNEIKGLTWLVTNNPRPGSSGSVMLSNMASRSTPALELDQTSSFSPSNPAEDSGAESHQTLVSPNTKRSSISSFGSSSSSTSSLSLGTLTPATTVISLRSIPETTAPSTRSQDPVAAAYSANHLKRIRPPSIAQVLAQSPKMEHGRDKLRSYGTSGSASS